ncbi:MAG: DUF222 domain-containing protein, partial [Nocardioides sp.]
MRAEEALQIAAAAKYASFHEVDDWTRAASLLDGVPGGEGEMLLGGDGCAYVTEFAVVEFAAATGRSTSSGRVFLAQAVELVHRLPRTWARVKAGQVDGWRARRVAEATMTLPREAAAWVDVHIASRVDRVGTTTLDRLIEEAKARFDPEQLVEDEAGDLAERRVELVRNPTGRAATTRVEAVLDTTDAHDLDSVLDEIADQLAACDGLAEAKAVRRARALGMLARGEVGFARTDSSQTSTDTGSGSTVHVQPRRVDLRVRVAEGETHAIVHSLTGQHLGMVTIDRLHTWCTHSQVT